MTLREVDKSQLSPMMLQYYETKMKYRECILFYRLGDFYEMFFDDAIQASRELELTLTGRDCGLPERAPMCGVPYHSAELYIKRLIDLGYRVAICEQMEDPALAKGLVTRDVIRVVTPGTIIENDLLDDASNNYLCCAYTDAQGTALGFADLSTGEAAVYPVGAGGEEEIINLLSRYRPAELIFNARFLDFRQTGDFIKIRLKCACAVRDDNCFDPVLQSTAVCRQFSVDDMAVLGLPADSAQTRAVCGLFEFIADTQKTTVGRFTELTLSDASAYMTLDYNALRNLELTRTMRTGDKKGSLLWVLDSTRTPMGKRMLKSWAERPLRSPARIMARLDAVETLMKNTLAADDLTDALGRMYDMERLMTRIVYKQATPRDLRALCASVRELPGVRGILDTLPDPHLTRLRSRLADLSTMELMIDRAIIEDPPAVIKDGGVIKKGFDPDLDKLRSVMNGGSTIIEQIGDTEREKTGIKNLKVGFHRTFGYYLEVTRSYLDKVPDYFIRKQTMTNAERFITPELKEAENTVLNAKDKSLQLELELYEQVRDFLAQMLPQVQETAAALAELDVLCSFAETAAKNDYCKPDIVMDGSIRITDGRHPVVEQMLTEEGFVPNDVYMDTADSRLTIITGPNMSGKSTYMRQTALIVLMAQMGSFVPAQSARISVCDRIFTRVGASDDLAAGESTFMVEMKEVAEILKNATRDSLVILDEVGRGTSTFDGLSIARAVAEHICTGKKLGCKTLFATHYHELTVLASELPGVKNCSIAVKKGRDGIRFLRKIVPGGTDDSYGIDVAKLAGLPGSVLKRARELLAELESEREHVQAPAEAESQISFAAQQEREIPRMLRQMHIGELSDAECREFLEQLYAMLDD
ncbi:MAG: DNA mismatch repair protein MutS [Oscillospiraceae bacterium]|nr:DNA mismatch repair protein MutS [Oscillospiraceae bacterium]